MDHSLDALDTLLSENFEFYHGKVRIGPGANQEGGFACIPNDKQVAVIIDGFNLQGSQGAVTPDHAASVGSLRDLSEARDLPVRKWQGRSGIEQTKA